MKPEKLKNLFKTLGDDNELNSTRKLQAEAEREFILVEDKLYIAMWIMWI